MLVWSKLKRVESTSINILNTKQKTTWIIVIIAWNRPHKTENYIHHSDLLQTPRKKWSNKNKQKKSSQQHKQCSPQAPNLTSRKTKTKKKQGGEHFRSPLLPSSCSPWVRRSTSKSCRVMDWIVTKATPSQPQTARANEGLEYVIPVNRRIGRVRNYHSFLGVGGVGRCGGFFQMGFFRWGNS